jgi:hypothetical protein
MRLIILLLTLLVATMASSQKTSIAYGLYVDEGSKLMLISQSMVNVVYLDSTGWQHEMNASIREALSEEDSEALGLDDAYNVAMFDLNGVVLENEGDEQTAVIKVAEAERKDVIEKARKQGYRIYVFTVKIPEGGYASVKYVSPLTLKSLHPYKADAISKYLQASGSGLSKVHQD